MRMESAPGMARIRSRVAGQQRPCAARWLERRRSLPAAATSSAYAFGLILTTLASRIADALALSPLTFDLSIPIRNTGRSSTIGTPSSPSSSPRSGLRRRCDSRFVPSSWGCTMLGCQLVFHCPDSLASLASVAYVHRFRNAGKGPGERQLGGCDGAVPRDRRDGNGRLQRAHAGDERLEQIVDRWAGGADERYRREILRTETGRECGGRLVSSVAVAVRIRKRKRDSASGHRQDEDEQQASEADGSNLGLSVGRTQRHRVILPLVSAMGSVAAMGIYAKRPARMIGQLLETVSFCSGRSAGPSSESSSTE